MIGPYISYSDFDIVTRICRILYNSQYAIPSLLRNRPNTYIACSNSLDNLGSTANNNIVKYICK
jgi:hypothetical protein